MKWSFSGPDLGGLVFGRQVLLANPKAEIEFYIGAKGVSKSQTETDFFGPALEKILASETKFGRIGICYDRKNQAAKQSFENIDTTKFSYSQSRRGEKNPRIFLFETQVLAEMANEGLADTVEFRRLARKYLRQAKQSNVDTIFWAENILAEEKTRKILQHLAGTQMKLFFPVDFLPVTDKKQIKRTLKIHSSLEPSWLKKRAETILKTKLSEADFSFEKA